MEKFPKISIVTPSYNQGKYIEQTIDSILSQNYPNLDYIIIDGGSSDNSPEIIRKYEKYLSYWVSEKDKGQSDAINKGISKASGKIFNWINSDDWLRENVLFDIAEAFQDPNTLLFAGVVSQAREGVFTDLAGTRVFENPAKTVGFAAVNQPAMFYDFEVFKSLGGVTPELHFCMDQEMFIKFLFRYGQERIFSSKRVMVNFRIHAEAKSWDMTPFVRDTSSIFASVALQNSLEAYAGQFSKLNGTPHLKEYVFRLDTPFPDKEFLERSFQYFLFAAGEHFYYEKKYAKSFRYFSAVKKDLLDLKDAKLATAYLKDCVVSAFKSLL